tara:strand:- start:43285 stop:43914 length:630 start_codon:yes stop_codon:yes gene_type:complete
LISGVSLSTKASVRKELKERARVFVQVPTLRAAAQERIVLALQNLISNLTISEMAPLSGAAAVCVAGFNALSDEVDLASFYHSTSCSLVFPKLTAVDGVMEFTSVANYAAEKWVVSSLGFSHPSSVEVVPASDIQLMLIPGLGFSLSGERVGRGKGFYDRYLKNFKGLKVGVCFDCQLSEASLPTDSWDIKMDYIITETKCIDVRKLSV